MPCISQSFAKWENTAPLECFILCFLEAFHPRGKMKCAISAGARCELLPSGLHIQGHCFLVFGLKCSGP